MKWLLLMCLLASPLATQAQRLCLTAIGTTNTPPEIPDSTNAPLALTATMFPIEVLGPPDTTESFSLYVTNGHLADTLYLQVHGLTYDGKMSVRVNGGSWFTATDSNVTYPYVTERAFYGMGGIMSTLRMTIPATNWTCIDGTNTVQFRFNDLNGRTIGFRVLALNLQHATTNLIGSSQITQDNPQTWVPPSTNAVDIAAGRYAWYNETIGERGITLNVKCQDCHDQAGRDLKYFNYSARSIIERSVFHNISRATATNIASYILSLSVPYETNGRPWNPPYQPGAGMDSLPVRSWAAGAGLSAVLDDDLGTITALFPSGITTNALNVTNTISAREIPLAYPMPDWNHWLPADHPNDAYTNVYPADRYVTIYSEITNALASRTGTAAATYFNSKKSAWDAGNSTGVAKPATTSADYPEWARLRESIQHWRQVKTWEIMTGEEVEEQGTEVFAGLSADRRWFHGETFRLGPHVLGTPRYDAWAAKSGQWYQLQLVLNDGNRLNGSIVPIDWGYQHALNKSAWNNDDDYPLYGVMILNIIKGIEVMANGLPPTDRNGWDPMTPAVHGVAPGSTQAGFYAQIDADTRRDVAAAVVLAWLKECEKWTRDQYLYAGYLTSKTMSESYLETLATSLSGIGVSSAITDRLTAFKDSMYP